MASINSLKKQHEETLLNMDSNELKAYQKLLIQKLYKNFIENPSNTDELLKSKRRIEGNTGILSERYDNALEIELGLRLEEANKNLIQLLEDNNLLSKYYLERIHEDYISILSLSNNIMNGLLCFYEGNPSKEYKKLVLDIFESVENGLCMISFYVNLFDENDLVPDEAKEDFLLNELIQEYNRFEGITKKVKEL